MISLAGLSFLGLASQPPQPEWGAMLYESKQFMQVAPMDDVFSRTCFIYLCAYFNLLSEDIQGLFGSKNYEEKL